MYRFLFKIQNILYMDFILRNKYISRYFLHFRIFISVTHIRKYAISQIYHRS